MDILDQLEEKVKGAVDKINSLQNKIKKLDEEKLEIEMKMEDMVAKLATIETIIDGESDEPDNQNSEYQEQSSEHNPY